MDALEKRLELLEKQVKDLTLQISYLEMELQKERIKSIPWQPIQPMKPLQVPSGCPVCGLKMDTAMGYVCSHPHCPTRITCTS